MRAFRFLLGLSSIVFVAGCASETADDKSGTDDDNEVKVDTRSAEARRQYDANVSFANAYVPRCPQATPGRPRVLVTGFGRFMSIGNNATGRIVSTLVPAARYPETQQPAPGQVDQPEPQLSVGSTTIEVAGVGPVDVCGMILPVYWDLAAILIAKEAQALEPSFVLMNGVAGERQPIWIELGAINRAAKLEDGSNQLRPAVGPNEQYAKLVESATSAEESQGNLLSWRSVESAAKTAIERHQEDRDAGVRFGDVLPGVKLAGYPRLSNTYLCNNVTYTTGWLMSHPRREIKLLRASPALPGAVNEVRVKLNADLRKTPRVFVHWPSELADKHHAAGADVMKAIISSQLIAQKTGNLPAPGDNALADPTLQGGAHF
jgi:pyrrolidone-carboxylate peptidase